MGLFGSKKPAPADEFEQEKRDLLRSIQNRGMADIAGADREVNTYLAAVIADGGAAGSSDALYWARDRQRYFLAVGTMGWFGFIEQLGREVYLELMAEYRGLLDDEKSFGPEHIVAWWWLLQPTLFQPLVARQFEEMRAVLVELVQAIVAAGGDFRGQTLDWDEVRRGWAGL